MPRPRKGYEPLSGSHDHETIHDSTIEDEMERAFESDEEDEDTTPLTRNPASQASEMHIPNQLQEGAYDFEREYDRPPPGNPPTASGNSNGLIPSPTSVIRPDLASRRSKPSFFRRAVGALFPQHYSRVPVEEVEIATRLGGGLDNDGVFSNVTARPSPPRTVQDENGDVHVMPEEAQNEAPPSYAAAQADAVPPYWETTVHAPLGGSDDVIIEGLPAGSLLSFALNFLISVSFQFVGFMLTYLLHTSHAAKYGSRAGLGVTLIQYGLFSKGVDDDLDIIQEDVDGGAGTETTTSFPSRSVRMGRRSLSPRGFWSTTSDDTGEETIRLSTGSMHDWVSFLLMTIGWILVLTSILGFARVKRWERSVRTPTPETFTPESIRRDEEVRARLSQAFGI